MVGSVLAILNEFLVNGHIRIVSLIRVVVHEGTVPCGETASLMLEAIGVANHLKITLRISPEKDYNADGISHQEPSGIALHRRRRIVRP
jgi:hypothetical protein